MATGLSLDNIKPKLPTAQDNGAPTPTTSLGAQIGGANEDAAKMAGTAAQVRSSIQKNVAAGAPQSPILASQANTQQLAFADALRKADPSKIDATLEEQATAQRIQNESAVGKLKMDVKDMVAQASGDAVASGPTGLAKTDEDAIKSLLTKKGWDSNLTVAELQPQQQEEGLAELASSNPDLADQISESLGKGKVVVKNQLSKFAESQGKVGADADAFLDSMAKDLGLTGKADLEALSPQDFVKKLQDSISKDTAQVTALNTALSSPASSPAEKAAAKAELVRLGAYGLRTAAEQAKELASKSEEMDDIVVAGKTYGSLGALLKDNQIQGLMTRAMSSDPADKEDADAAMATLEEIGLGPVVEKYGKALKDQLTAAKGSLGKVIEDQKAVQDFLNISPTAKLSSQIAKSVIPGWDGTKLTTLPDSLKNFTSVVKTMSPVDQDALANTLNGLSQLGQHDLVKSIAGLSSPAEIKAMLPNLNMALGAEKAQHELDGLTPETLSYDKLRGLAQYGLIGAEDLDNFQMLGIPASEVYNTLQKNLTSVDEWKKINPELRPFGAEIFKIEPYKPTTAQWDKGFSTLVAATDPSPNSLKAIDNFAAKAPEYMQKQIKQLKTTLQAEYTNNTVSSTIGEIPAAPVEGTFSAPMDARARNALIDAAIKKLDSLKLEDNPYLNMNLIAQKRMELENSRTSQAQLDKLDGAASAQIFNSAIKGMAPTSPITPNLTSFTV